MAYKAGDLREHVELYSPAVTTNEYGYTTTAYSKNCEMAAAVTSVSGKDYFAALAAGALDTLTITLRWNASIDNGWKVRWNGQDYFIQEINVLGARRDYMTLKCTKT